MVAQLLDLEEDEGFAALQPRGNYAGRLPGNYYRGPTGGALKTLYQSGRELQSLGNARRPLAHAVPRGALRTTIVSIKGASSISELGQSRLLKPFPAVTDLWLPPHQPEPGLIHLLRSCRK